MAITIGWRKKDGKVIEKSFLGTEVPEGWFDNPRLEVIQDKPEVTPEVKPEMEAKPKRKEKAK